LEITKREVEEIDLSIAAKEREIENQEKNHLIELRMYQQRVKHLEYEHENNVIKIKKENVEFQVAETMHFSTEEESIIKSRQQLDHKRREDSNTSAMKVLDEKENNKQAVILQRKQFEDAINNLRARCERRLSELESDLELKFRVDEHELEERKNKHINELIRNHDKAFNEMKTYYNEITKDNLQLIRELQKQVEVKKLQATETKLKIAFYSSENLKLSEPLKEKRLRIAELQLKLKERSKDRMNLSNSKLRLRELDRDSKEVRHHDHITFIALAVANDAWCVLAPDQTNVSAGGVWSR
jgi:hypothetical protein